MHTVSVIWTLDWAVTPAQHELKLEYKGSAGKGDKTSVADSWQVDGEHDERCEGTTDCSVNRTLSFKIVWMVQELLRN